jgi:hypothetical protein
MPMKQIQYPPSRFSKPWSVVNPPECVEHYQCCCGARVKLSGTFEDVEHALKVAIKDAKLLAKCLEQLHKEIKECQNL